MSSASLRRSASAARASTTSWSGTGVWWATSVRVARSNRLPAGRTCRTAPEAISGAVRWAAKALADQLPPVDQRDGAAADDLEQMTLPDHRRGVLVHPHAQQGR